MLTKATFISNALLQTFSEAKCEFLPGFISQSMPNIHHSVAETMKLCSMNINGSRVVLLSSVTDI
jgi:hypothetical protein